MEKMSAKERELLLSLQAKAKRVQRAEEEFFKEADARKEELLSRWSMSDRLTEAATIVGTDPDTLFDYITSDRQVEYFRRSHPNQDDNNFL